MTNGSGEQDVSWLRALLAVRAPAVSGRGEVTVASGLRQFGTGLPSQLSRALPVLLDAAGRQRQSRRRFAGGVTVSVRSGSGVSVDIRKGRLHARMGLERKAARSAGLLATPLQVDQCPSADGVVSGHAVGEIRGFFVLPGQLHVDVRILTRAELTGQVGDDAKLKSLKLDDEELVTVTLAGPGAGSDPKALVVPVSRHALVDLTTNLYVPAVGATAMLLPSGSGAAGVQAAMVAGPFADQAFEQMLIDARTTLHVNETQWNIPNTCAKLVFTPGQGPPARPGDTGALTAEVDAHVPLPVRGAQLTATASTGAIAPGAATTGGDGRAPLTWTAGAASGGDSVVAQVDAVSRAGRASGSWVAPSAHDEQAPAFRITSLTSTLNESTPGPIPYGTATTTNALVGPGDIVSYPAQTECANDLLSNFGPCGGIELTATVKTLVSSQDFGLPDDQLCPGGSFSFQYSLSNPDWADLWLNPYDAASTPEVREFTPSLGVGDIESDHCGAVTEARTDGQLIATGNRGALLAGTPVTFHITGGGTEGPSFGSKNITWTFEKTVTLQRVDPDGTPYTP